MTNKPASQHAGGSSLWDGFEVAYGNAKRPSLQAFPFGLSHSNAFNAAPFVISLDQFVRDFSNNPYRQSLSEKFIGMINRLPASGCLPQYALVGGSFIDVEIAEPNDLDGVVFYTHDDQLSPEMKSLHALQADAHEAMLDIRFISTDMHPAVLAKITGFFSILYAQNRNGGGARPCLIISLVS